MRLMTWSALSMSPYRRRPIRFPHRLLLELRGQPQAPRAAHVEVQSRIRQVRGVQDRLFLAPHVGIESRVRKRFIIF